MTTAVKFISGAEIRAKCADVASQVALQRQTFINFHRGSAVMGPRAVIAGAGANANFSYLARASPSGPAIVKFGSTVPPNATRTPPLPVVNAYMFVMGSETGQLAAQLDGEAVTTMRTSASSMAAAMELSRAVFGSVDNVKRIAVVGAGVQGREHARMALEMFPTIEKLTMCSSRGRPSRSAGSSSEDAHALAENSKVEFKTDYAESSSADVIFLCTSSSTPVVETLIPENSKKVVVSVGSFAPNNAEVSVGDCLRCGAVFVDDVTTCLGQCGSIVQAVKQGTGETTVMKESKVHSIGARYAASSVAAETGQNASKAVKSEFWSAIYFSVGLGIQDAAVAEYLALK